ncbi:MAG: class I SAM-dependent methyltransferase [Bacteroidales bacterium]
MQPAAPGQFSDAELRDRIHQITWCHPIDFGNGVVTRPEWHVRQRFARRLKFLALPADLSGKTVLDIGAWDGFFSFECERRGAARVLAIDTYAWDVHGKAGFLLAHSVLRSKVESMRLAAEDLDSRAIGRFDLVLFLGVLYHLRSPITVLDRLRDVTAGTLVCETHGLVPALHARYPLVSFFPGDGHERGTPYEFTAIPTLECLRQMLASAGFGQVDVKCQPSLRPLKKLKALVTNRPQSGRLIVHAR